MGVDTTQLMKAVDWSNTQLERPRANRLAAIKQFVGAHYTDGGSGKAVPVNMLELAVTIYVRHLAARAPRVLVSTGVHGLRAAAETLAIALNQIPDEIDMGPTLRRSVLEALFGIGVCKVGICSSGMTAFGHDVGESFVDVVTLDDYFLDMTADTMKEIQFEGNDYWLPIDDARAMYGNDTKPDEYTITSAEGENRAKGVEASEGADLYREKIKLRDVWLPDTGDLVTYSVTSKKVFRSDPWDGPEHGPYYKLGFSEVPGNLLPLPPVALWRDLHDLGNAVFRKLGKQAQAKKSVVAFHGGDEDSAKALKTASDGEGIRYDGQKPEPITVGGIDPQSLAFYIHVRGELSYYAGNLDTLGGLSPMTETVGQDKLLSDAASSRMSWMQDNTLAFAEKIFKALAWNEWTDPVRKRTIDKPLKGTDIVFRREWSEETREGNFLDYNLKIDVYSMQDNTPAIQLQKLGSVIDRYVYPAMDALQQQGGQVDFKRLLEMVGEYGNIPELSEVIVFTEPSEGAAQQGGSPTPTTKAANGTTTHVRVNRPGATRHGKDDAMQRLLMGAKVQGSEAAAIGRPSS